MLLYAGMYPATVAQAKELRVHRRATRSRVRGSLASARTTLPRLASLLGNTCADQQQHCNPVTLAR